MGHRSVKMFDFELDSKLDIKKLVGQSLSYFTIYIFLKLTLLFYFN